MYFPKCQTIPLTADKVTFMSKFKNAEYWSEISSVRGIFLFSLKTDIFHIAAAFAKAFPKIYQGRLSSPFPRSAFPLKHLYGFKLHRSLLMYADLSWYLVAVDQALILQCNSMLRSSSERASKHIWKGWLCTGIVWLGNSVRELCFC